MSDRSLYDQALTLLEYRARTVEEIRRRLRGKGGSAAEVEQVIERLLDQKLLDDVDYARQYARGKIGGSGASRYRVVQELSRKGIRRDDAAAAVEEVTEEGIDPLHSALRLARRKWNALAAVDPATRKRRLYAFLARRGFNPDEIRELMAALGMEAEDED